MKSNSQKLVIPMNNSSIKPRTMPNFNVSLLGTHHFDWITISQPCKVHCSTEKRLRFLRIISALRGLIIFEMPRDKSSKTIAIDSECGNARLEINGQSTSLQLRGTFCLIHRQTEFHKAKEIFKMLYLKVHKSKAISKKIEDGEPIPSSYINDWRITRIDIQSTLIGDNLRDLFPLRQDDSNYLQGDPNLHWTTKCDPRPFINNGIANGYTHFYKNSRITVYNKSKESDKEKNLHKKRMFHKAYPEGKTKNLMRIELRLEKKDRCIDLTNYYIKYSQGINPKDSRTEVIEKILQRFTRKNKVYLNSKKYPASLKKLDPRLESFFTTFDKYTRNKCEKPLLPKSLGGLSDAEIETRAISMLTNLICARAIKSGPKFSNLEDEIKSINLSIEASVKRRLKESHDLEDKTRRPFDCVRQ